MSPGLRRCALFLVLLSVPALAAPAREDRRVARLRPQAARPEVAQVQPSEAIPIAAAAADGGGVDLAGLLGMLTALTGTYVYARGQRIGMAARSVVRPSGSSAPPDRR